ncbi:MAG: pyruvate, phosphate dikinase [Planctomycetota bacterium]|nr:MAG: pyruvate, phosphate dikinase [Planctomycetota bacterium]
MATKWVYSFGGGKADGKAHQKELLGGKGANLAEMARLRLPVPAGFTITTQMCTEFYRRGKKLPPELIKQVKKALARVEKIMGKKFGDPNNPLLVSSRSGARKSMPGMMETVLNIGLTSKTLPGLATKTGNPRFAWDSYRRLIQMYADVVMEKAEGIEPAEDQGVRRQLERELERIKKEKGYKNDTELTVEDLQTVVSIYKDIVQRALGKPFPDDAMEQLWGGIRAVFQSWNGKRAVSYRRIENIPDDWGTAVNVQAMVFGNMGENSATGVAFTRNPATGENLFYGEWLINAQGEDVVAGLRTPSPLNEATRPAGTEGLPSLEQNNPKIYKQLYAVRNRLDRHFCDMQDIEFTIEQGKLYMLQTRVGKRTGMAAVRMAVEMAKSKLITPTEAIQRVTADQLNEVLLPILDANAERIATKLCTGLPAGPGGATGQVVFTAEDAVKWVQENKTVILVREETNPEDVEGMRAAVGILTARGGMTSHAALVARGWGKCCVVGAGEIEVDLSNRRFQVNGQVINQGDWVSLNGTKGIVYNDRLPLVAGAEDNPYFDKFMAMCDKIRKLGVRANADTPADAQKARQFGAQGIGLFRTEHMFYGKGAEEPLFKLRKMIHAHNTEERKAALDELFQHVKADFKATLEEMDGLPVTIRLLDPPLHEFVPQNSEERERLANSLGISQQELAKRAEDLEEVNPMMGHRGVRLGITYPEVSEMQIRAILEAAAELIKSGKKALPEIMIPVTCDANELRNQKVLVDRVHKEVAEKFGMKKVPHLYGTMIEIPRAALKAAEFAEVAEFFSFGTNDLTQMTFGFSRDDVGGFVPDYLKNKIMPADPFQILDQSGVGELVQLGIERGRSTRPKLKVGICGEHGGELESVKFCHRIGMDYVSCSPYRVPIARLALAQAVIEDSGKKKASKAKAKPGKKAKKTTKAKGKKTRSKKKSR